MERWRHGADGQLTASPIDRILEDQKGSREMEELKLKDDYIKLGQALKAANLVDSGVMAKLVVQDGLVSVNGEVETRRGKKLTDGDIVSFEGETVKIVK